MFFVFFRIHTRNQNVVHVDEREGQAPQDAVHEPLECLCSILQTPRHAQVLVETERSNDGGLWNGVAGHRNLIISTHEIDLGKDFSSAEIGIEVLNVGKRVTIVRRGLVQSSIVAAGAPASSRFGCYMKR